MRIGGVLGLLLLLACPAPGTSQNVIAFDGLISNRAEKAFGAGLTLALGIPVLSGSIGGTYWAFKGLVAADLEVVTGALTDPGICRYTEPSGGKFYYRDCSGSLDAYPPNLAEASSPTRAYVAAYGILDVWRLRLGIGRGGHPGAGDDVLSGLIGFATSASSWLMVERPGSGNGKEWRLRVEVAIAGPPFAW